MIRGVLLLLGVFSSLVLAEPRRQLVIYTWPAYFDPVLLAEFSEEFDVEVKEVWYSSDEEKDSEFFLHYQRYVDIVVGAGQLFSPYIKAKALAPLPESLTIPEQEPVIKERHPMLKGFAVPFSWGTMGIAYRKDLLPEPPQRWMDILRPTSFAGIESDKMQGQINMISESLDLLEMARMALGIPAGELDEAALASIKALLLEQRPYVSTYTYMDPSPHAGLVTGSVAAAVLYNGDALALRQWSDQIEYVIPAEGSTLWVDYLVINARAPNKSAADDFMAFFARPDISARNTRFFQFASPFVQARAHLPADVLENPVIYPAQAVEKMLVVPGEPSVSLRRYLNNLKQQLKY